MDDAIAAASDPTRIQAVITIVGIPVITFFTGLLYSVAAPGSGAIIAAPVSIVAITVITDFVWVDSAIATSRLCCGLGDGFCDRP